MDANLLFICFLTLVIHVVGTLAYAVRIAGIRMRRIAISFSLFNILCGLGSFLVGGQKFGHTLM
jgi:hypothetical protein